MAVPSYPSSLPGFNIGLRVQPRAGFVSTPMSVGPPKRRRRYSATPSDYVGDITLSSDAQLTTFQTFYHTTLSEGSKPFTMTDPVSGQSATFAFVSPPSYRFAGGEPGSSGKVALVALALEKRP